MVQNTKTQRGEAATKALIRRFAPPFAGSQNRSDQSERPAGKLAVPPLGGLCAPTCAPNQTAVSNREIVRRLRLDDKSARRPSFHLPFQGTRPGSSGRSSHFAE